MTLLEAYENDCQAQGIVPDVRLIDYSLTKTLGLQGLQGMGKESLLETGKVSLHMGPLEVVNLKDAHGADVMISSTGPFIHVVETRHQLELVVKVALELAPGGRAFLEVAQPIPGIPDIFKHRLQEELGDEFTVELGLQKQNTWWPGIVVIGKKL